MDSLPTGISALTLSDTARRGKVDEPTRLRLDKTVPLGDDVALQMVSFDRSNNLVVPLCWKNEVHVYDARTGALVRKVGKAGDHNAPMACVEDSCGRLYVTERAARCVNVFRADGSVERTIGGGKIDDPMCLDLSRDEATLYVAMYGYQSSWASLQAYDTRTGKLLRETAYPSVPNPIGVAVLSTGQVAVASYANAAGVSILNADGSLVRFMRTGTMVSGCQLAVDRDDNVYVADHQAHNVAVFSADGRASWTFGGGGQLSNPYGIAVDSAGTVAVVEYQGKRVQLFKSG